MHRLNVNNTAMMKQCIDNMDFMSASKEHCEYLILGVNPSILIFCL